jgi:hypothetical protein
MHTTTSRIDRTYSFQIANYSLESESDTRTRLEASFQDVPQNYDQPMIQS